jgi:hypothetical protein
MGILERGFVILTKEGSMDFMIIDASYLRMTENHRGEYTIYWISRRLALDNHRHDDRSTSSEEVAVLGDLTTQRLDECPSLDTLILEDELLIGRTDSLEDLLVDRHHLMRMDEST